MSLWVKRGAKRILFELPMGVGVLGDSQPGNPAGPLHRVYVASDTHRDCEAASSPSVTLYVGFCARPSMRGAAGIGAINAASSMRS